MILKDLKKKKASQTAWNTAAHGQKWRFSPSWRFVTVTCRTFVQAGCRGLSRAPCSCYSRQIYDVEAKISVSELFRKDKNAVKMAFECSLLIISFLSSPKTISGPSLDILVFCEYFQANLFFFFFYSMKFFTSKNRKTLANEYNLSPHFQEILN